MQISGIQRLTLVDFPGRPAALFFTAGCNLRCGYCHNPEFVLPEKIAALASSFIPFEAALAFLRQRVGLLAGVVISGGEPTLQADLEKSIRAIRALGFAVKLDTNGTRPDVVQKLLDKKLLDYVAMDFKLPPARYAELGGNPDIAATIRTSLGLLKKSGVDFELRTTVVPGLHDDETLQEMARTVGTARWFLQAFRHDHCLDPDFKKRPSVSRQELERFAELARVAGARVIVR